MNFFNGVKKTKRLHKWIWHEHSCDWWTQQIKQEVRYRLYYKSIKPIIGE